MTANATAVATTETKAGFWIRTFAYIIDGILLAIVGSIIGAVMTSDPLDPTRSTINLLLGLVYFVYFWSAQGGGQTLGMRALGLKVIRTDGSMLTFTQGVIRYVGLFISFVVVFIGVIWVAFDANKQGWHDKIAGTYVVRTK